MVNGLSLFELLMLELGLEFYITIHLMLAETCLVAGV